MKTALKNNALSIGVTMTVLLCALWPAPLAHAMERKPPMHIRVGEPNEARNPASKTNEKAQAPQQQTVKEPHRKTSTSCPLIITGKNASHGGIRINLIRQDRKALQLATALREDFFRKGRDTQFISALYDASIQTETNFELLVIKAMMESNLGQLNFAEATTARGTFQYIESTWLSLIQRYGKKAGYPDYAMAIIIDPVTLAASLRPEDESKRTAILALRFDPYIAALMKGFQINEETAEIQKFKNGGYVGITDHYVTHMLGLTLARKFYEMKNENSQEPLADPKLPAMLAAAERNRPFFYDDDAKPLTAAQSYTRFEQRVTTARRRMATILRKYLSKGGGCGRFEPVPPYEPQKPVSAALEAKNGIWNLSFFETLLTPAQETTHTHPEETKEKIVAKTPPAQTETIETEAIKPSVKPDVPAQTAILSTPAPAPQTPPAIPSPQITQQIPETETAATEAAAGEENPQTASAVILMTTEENPEKEGEPITPPPSAP